VESGVRSKREIRTPGVEADEAAGPTAMDRGPAGGRPLAGSSRAVSVLFGFLWTHKLWWLIPMMVTLLLLSLLIVLGHNPVLAPFIYTLF